MHFHAAATDIAVEVGTFLVIEEDKWDALSPEQQANTLHAGNTPAHAMRSSSPKGGGSFKERIEGS